MHKNQIKEYFVSKIKIFLKYGVLAATSLLQANECYNCQHGDSGRQGYGRDGSYGDGSRGNYRYYGDQQQRYDDSGSRSQNGYYSRGQDGYYEDRYEGDRSYEDRSRRNEDRYNENRNSPKYDSNYQRDNRYDNDDRRDNRYEGEGDRKNGNQELVSDQDLTQAVRDKISSGWFSKGYEGVNVQASQGVVTLQGTVKNEEEKKSLDRAVRDIKGVKEVRNQVRIQGGSPRDNHSSKKLTSNLDTRNNTYTNQSQRNQSQGNLDREGSVSDQELLQKIRDKIGSGWFSKGYENVNVEVSNGVVTLQGMVKNADEQKSLEDTVRELKGVRDVNNMVKIQESARRY